LARVNVANTIFEADGSDIPEGKVTFMQFFVLRVASNKEDRVRESLARKVKIEGLETHVGRILVPSERVKTVMLGQ